MKKLLSLLMIMFVSFGLVACSAPEAEVPTLEGEIAIDGSSTVYPIIELVSEEFNAVNPDVQITVGFSGTGGGFTKFAAGETDISNASRAIKFAEADALKAANIEYTELKIAVDGLSVVVSKDNTWVDYLTFEELAMIYGPEATAVTWQDVRAEWPAEKLVIYSPGHDSGTFDYFTEAVNGKAAVIRPDSDTVKISYSEDDNVLVTGVAGDKGAIGYFGFAYFEENMDKLKAVPLQKAADKDIVEPSFDNIMSNAYPLSRPLFIYVANSSLEREEVKAYVIFTLENAAELATEVGYVSLPDQDYTDALAKIQ